MGAILSRILTVTIGLCGIVVASFFLWQSWVLLKEMPPDRGVASVPEGAPEEGASAHGATEHGADGHGDASKTASTGHEGAPSEQGAKAEGAGATAGGPAQATRAMPRTWVSLDQMFVNLAGQQNEGHAITFQIEIELFDEAKRNFFDSRVATVKSAAIEVARDQSYKELQSLSGKLYFKESLISAMNQTLHAPVVRDIHLNSLVVK